VSGSARRGALSRSGEGSCERGKTGGEYPVQATTTATRIRAAKRNKKKEPVSILRAREAATVLFEAQPEFVASDLECQKCLHIRSIPLVIGCSG